MSGCAGMVTVSVCLPYCCRVPCKSLFFRMHSIIVSMSGCLVVSSSTQDWNRQIWSTRRPAWQSVHDKTAQPEEATIFRRFPRKGCRSLFECSKECRHRVSLHVLSDLRRRPRSKSWFIAIMHEAASVLPPAIPAATGICLSSVIDTFLRKFPKILP